MNFIEYMFLADIFGSLKIVSIVSCIVFLLALSVVGFMYIDTPPYCDDDDEIKKYKKLMVLCKKLMVLCSIVSFVSLAIFIFTPSKKTMYIVAGVSAVKEFSQSEASNDMKDMLSDLKIILHDYAEPKQK